MTAPLPLPATTALGTVTLRVPDAERARAFYGGVLGLEMAAAEGGGWELSVGGGAPLLRLIEEPGATRPRGRSTGLYHLALLVPHRRDLAGVLLRLRDAGWPLQGASDHGVSEALYLADGDGNGIEIYADRPREEWPRSGEGIAMTTLPLALGSLLAEAGSDRGAGLPPGTTVGHIHLHVSELGRSLAFFRDVVGFDVTARYGDGAVFVSAGGYHHHLGLNTWAGVGAPRPPAGSVGLVRWEVRVPGDALAAIAERAARAGVGVERTGEGVELEDPDGVRLRVAE